MVTTFSPASIGNVGPGFDVLGLAVEGLGDRVSLELTDGPTRIVSVTGRDAALIPLEPSRNAAAVAAEAMLRRLGVAKGARISIDKGLPLAGGLGGSAASSVGGALAALLAAREILSLGASAADSQTHLVLAAALAGESAVAGRHLDNLAPCVLGGLTLCRSVDPIEVISIPVLADWWLALVTPAVRVETRAARAILPESSERSEWVQQMANTAALVWAFSTGDAELLRRALDDRYAEPRRASLIPHFQEAKAAALKSGALGCSISGSGPTLFAIAADEHLAGACARAMQQAFAEIPSTQHVGRVARQGARAQ